MQLFFAVACPAFAASSVSTPGVASTLPSALRQLLLHSTLQVTGTRLYEKHLITRLGHKGSGLTHTETRLHTEIQIVHSSIHNNTSVVQRIRGRASYAPMSLEALLPRAKESWDETESPCLCWGDNLRTRAPRAIDSPLRPPSIRIASHEVPDVLLGCKRSFFQTRATHGTATLLHISQICLPHHLTTALCCYHHWRASLRKLATCTQKRKRPESLYSQLRIRETRWLQIKRPKSLVYIRTDVSTHTHSPIHELQRRKSRSVAWGSLDLYLSFASK